MATERDIVRTNPAYFHKEGFQEMNKGFWVKKVPDGLNVRIQCTMCHTITNQAGIEGLTEGAVHIFECVCGTEKKIIVPSPKRTITVVEVEKSKELDGINSMISD